jgi:uncharacterized protein YecE (DUF72 family)
MAGRVFIGTSGFNYKDWKEIFYPKGTPQKKWLAFYAQHYDTVEINATFYRYFARSVFARWRAETPDHFCFTLKGPRVITHEKRLVDVQADLDRFLDSLQDIRPKLATLLWQFPFSFKNESDADKETFAQFLQCLPSDIQQVIEFRHTSWFNEDVYALLNAHNAGFVINDSSRFPAVEVITGGVCYIRFHGPKQLYASSYTEEAMQLWATKIRAWREHYDVYVYFNNDYGGRAIENANQLINFLKT